MAIDETSPPTATAGAVPAGGPRSANQRPVRIGRWHDFATRGARAAPSATLVGSIEERNTIMRTIGRLATGLAAATLMLTGTVLGAVAQSPDASSSTPDPMAAVYVTGTLGPVDFNSDGTVGTADMVTSSDPRLGGVLTYVETKVQYPGDIGVGASRAEIRSDDGAWVGTGTEYSSDKGETMILTGEGAYAGLTAYLNLDWGTPGRPFTGIIFPGEMPEPPPLP